MSFREKINDLFFTPSHSAPLAVLRIVFGALMFISIIRFIIKGWIYDFYVAPKMFFPFYGFEWIKPLGETGMYIVFALLALTSFMIMLGWFYRISITLFFFSFLYVELLDKTNYLNHYYFISIMAFLMMLVPAHRYFSLDIVRKPSLKVTTVPGWTIGIFKLQLLLVYFFAGLAKLNYDWMLEAMPLKIWLPAQSDLPVLGYFLDQEWVAYLFSWFGAVYDLSIGFLLLTKSTRGIAYFLVILFHVFTGWLFKIGMFPYIMIGMTIVFFSEDFHKKLIQRLKSFFIRSSFTQELSTTLSLTAGRKKILYTILVVYFSIQLLLPFRYLLYPGELFWTEEGYRFSWRVMLMEKGGVAFFYVKDPSTGNSSEIMNTDYLTPLQEKMMVTQPDMILQYAHFLEEEYKKKGIKNPVVTVESYVTLNGSRSKLFIDKEVDLTKQKESLLPKAWVLSYKK